MSQSQTIELGPNDQETVRYKVEDSTDRVLVTLKSSDHNKVTTIPSWEIEDDEFSEDEQGIGEYPARLEPLGDVLKLKVRNQTDRDTTVTVGIREKKLVV